MKRGHVGAVLSDSRVAPHAGAWIETRSTWLIMLLVQVAPHAGAWIETACTRPASDDAKSPPTRGRGLKPECSSWDGRTGIVAPHAGAWIETDYTKTPEEDDESPPTRGRGLKRTR